MFQTLVNKQLRILRQSVSALILIAFGINTVMPAQLVMAQTVPAGISGISVLPQVGTLLSPSIQFNPAIMAGITLNPENPLQFDFIIDTGDDYLTGNQLETESKRLINYFLTTLTVPDHQLWVNLSPTEKDRIIADKLVQTEMGRDMLAQDYLLKQLMASLMYPEKETGREFWDRVHKKAYQQYGTTDIPTNTFNKIWIVPQKAEVYIHQQSVFVVDSHLKVLLEEDYLTLKEHTAESADTNAEWSQTTKDIIKTILIPEIEYEINNGKNFAHLRQIYQSMLLATWYKKNLKESLLGQIYIGQNLVKGIDLADKGIKEKIYQQYLEAFKEGVFDYIKEDIHPETQRPIPRRYFSGGLEGIDQAMINEVEAPLSYIRKSRNRRHVIEEVRFDVLQPDMAALVEEKQDPVAYLNDPDRRSLFNDLIRAHGDYNIYGDVDPRFEVIDTGYSRTAIQIKDEFPNLVFKMPRYDALSEPPSNDEPLIMSALAEKLGFEIVTIDGIDLIKMPGIAPFRYYNNIVIQAYGQEATQLTEFEEVKRVFTQLGIQWNLSSNPRPEKQLKNIRIYTENVDGQIKRVARVIDNKDFSLADFAQLSEQKILAFESELGLTREQIIDAHDRHNAFGGYNPKDVREAFAREMGMKKDKLAEAVFTHPPLAGYDPAKVKKDYGDVFGLTEAQLAKAIHRYPPLAGLDPQRIANDFFRMFSMSKADIAHYIQKHPPFAGYDPDKINNTFYTEFGLSTEQIATMLHKFPALGNYDLKRVKADYKRELGFDSEQLAAVLPRYPQLLSLNITRVRTQFRDILGISRGELSAAIKEIPSIAGYNVETNLQTKLTIIAELGEVDSNKLITLKKILTKNNTLLRRIMDIAMAKNFTIPNVSALASMYKRLNSNLTRDENKTGPQLLKSNPDDWARIIDPYIDNIVKDFKDESAPTTDEAALAQNKPLLLSEAVIYQLSIQVGESQLIRDLKDLRNTLGGKILAPETIAFAAQYLATAINYGNNPFVRQYAIEALAEIPTEESLKIIMTRKNIAQSSNTDPNSYVREAEFKAMAKIIRNIDHPVTPALFDDIMAFVIERQVEDIKITRHLRTQLLKDLATSPGISYFNKQRTIKYLVADLDPDYEAPKGRLIATKAIGEIGTTTGIKAILYRGDRNYRRRAKEPEANILATQIDTIRHIIHRDEIDSSIVRDIIAFTVQEGLSHPDDIVRSAALLLLADLSTTYLTTKGQKRYILQRLARRFRDEHNFRNASFLRRAIPIVNAHYQGSKQDNAMLNISDVTPDFAMIASPEKRLDIAAAKTGLTTDTQVFHLLITKVPDSDIMTILFDLRQAKEDGLRTNKITENIFLDFNAMLNSQYAGVRQFANLLQTNPEMISALDRMVRREIPTTPKGIILPPQRRIVADKVAQIKQSQDIKLPATQNQIAALRLSVSSKNQMRAALIGSMNIRLIPILIENILDIREDDPESFENIDTLKKAMGDFAQYLTDDILAKFNTLFEKDEQRDAQGLIENSEFQTILRSQIAVIKIGEASEKELMSALVGSVAEGQIETYAQDILAQDSEAFKNVSTIQKAPNKISLLVTENINLQTKIDSLVTTYEKFTKKSTPSIVITQTAETAAPLPGLNNTPAELDLTTPIEMHRFANSADLMYLFQQQINRFPRVKDNGGPKRLMFSEFGGIMIRPEGEAQNRLTHIVFPETNLSIPGAGRSLRGHSDISFPQAKLMADVSTDSLYAKVMADRITDDEFTERVSLVLSTNDVFFNSDLWNYFSKHDQQILSQHGFGPGMTFEQWAVAIKNYSVAFLNQYETNGQIVTFRELPLNINQRGNVGTLMSYHQMPGFLLYAFLSNIFKEFDYYEVGSAHIHPEKEFKGLSEKVAKRIGERKAQMTISPADVGVWRKTLSSHSQIMKKHNIPNKETAESFISIVGVDEHGTVNDIQHHDVDRIQDIDKLSELNDRALQTLESGNPDIGVIVEHYEFFSDPSIASNELSDQIGAHVGDRTYVRSNDEAMLVKFDQGEKVVHKEHGEGTILFVNARSPEDYYLRIAFKDETKDLSYEDAVLNIKVVGIHDDRVNIESTDIDLKDFNRKTERIVAIARQLREIQKKTIVDYNTLDLLTREVNEILKPNRLVPLTDSKEFKDYIQALASLFVSTPIPLDFNRGEELPIVHHEIRRVLSSLTPIALERAQSQIIAAFKKHQRSLSSKNLVDSLNKGLPVVIDSVTSLESLFELQNRVNGMEINFLPLKDETRSVVIVSLGAEDTARSLNTLANLPSFVDIHTHGYSLPINPSDEDTYLAEYVADTTARSSLVLGFNRQLHQLEMAEYTPESRHWDTYQEDRQDFIHGKLKAIGLIKDRSVITPDTKIAELDSIEVSSATYIRTREDLKNLIDPPLLKAIQILYDKNILTEAASANRTDVARGYAYIHIPYSELSGNNQLIGVNIGDRIITGVRENKVFAINIKIDQSTTVEDLEEQAIAVANQFQKQPMTWAQTYTLEQMRTEIYHKPNMTIGDIVNAGWFYDQRGQRFYLSQEHYDKVHEKDQAMTSETLPTLQLLFGTYLKDSNFMLGQLKRKSLQLNVLAAEEHTLEQQRRILQETGRMLDLIRGLKNTQEFSKSLLEYVGENDPHSEYTIFINTLNSLLTNIRTDLLTIQNQFSLRYNPQDTTIVENIRQAIRQYDTQIQELITLLTELGRDNQYPLISEQDQSYVFTDLMKFAVSPKHLRDGFRDTHKIIGGDLTVVGEESTGLKLISNRISQLSQLAVQMAQANPNQVTELDKQYDSLIGDISIAFGALRLQLLTQRVTTVSGTQELVGNIVAQTLYYIFEERMVSLLNQRPYLESVEKTNIIVNQIQEEFELIKRRIKHLIQTDSYDFEVASPSGFVQVAIEQLVPRSDEAIFGQNNSLDPLGGIDFNPNNFEIDQNDKAIPYNSSMPVLLPQGPIEGIIPVIINITPVANFPLLLGFTFDENRNSYTQVDPKRDRLYTRQEDQLSYLSN